MRCKAGLFSRYVPFSPAVIAGLTGWWDASDSSTLFDATSGGSTVAADGDVARWEDKSANGRHFSQSTAASRPVRKTAIKNGLDVVRFDGTNDFMASIWLLADIIAASSHTVFAVAAASAATTDDATYGNAAIIQDEPDYTATGLFAFRSSNLVSSYGWDGAAHQVASKAYTIGGWKVFTSQHGSGALSLRVNGAGGGSDASISELAFFGSTARLGSEYGAFLDGDVAEVVAYNVALSAGDREAVESYLTDKWGIS